MTFEEAKKFLNDCNRSELRDHAFGDVEVWWTLGTLSVATGYFSGTKQEVTVAPSPGENYGFEGDEAIELQGCGTLTIIERNDATGPETFTKGSVRPGLTKENIFDELTQ